MAIAGGLVAVIVIGGAGFFLGRSTAPELVEPAPVAVATPAPLPAPALETPEILGRVELIRLAGIAADVTASGDIFPETVTAIAGRRFEIALPFGCSGPAGADAGTPMRWSYEDSTEALRVTANPVGWSMSDWGLDEAAGRLVEGFWIGRPWTSADNCPPGNIPAASPGMEAITLPGQTLAIGQIFPGDANRDAQRGSRPYEIVRRVPQGSLDASDGFRLRLVGRIGTVAGGQPIRCVQPAGPEQRPICLIAARIDDVSLENPRTKEVLATWRPGVVK